MEQEIDLGIEIHLDRPDSFLKIRETLTRIGIPSKKERRLYQSVHILHKKGKYYLLHFKRMFLLDGKPSSLSEDDVARENTIAKLLEDWGLVEIVDRSRMTVFSPVGTIKVITYKEKNQWICEAKYSVGNHF